MVITITGYYEYTAEPETNHEIYGLSTLYSRIMLDTETDTIYLTHERAPYEGTPEREWAGQDVPVAAVPYILTAEQANEMLAAACDLDDTDDIANLVEEYGQSFGRRIQQAGEDYEAASACETAESIRRQLAASGLEPTEERVRALAEADYAQRDGWEYWPTEDDENVAQVTWLVDHDAWIGHVLDELRDLVSGVAGHGDIR
jgi:hypothetical protein